MFTTREARREIMTVEIINAADLPDSQGITRRAINSAKSHTIPVGALVEIASGARMFIVDHHRDCDGTPLYALSGVMDGLLTKEHTGYPAESLTLIHKS